MPKRIPPLSELRVSKARPAEKPFKLSDGGGLHVLVTPTGGRLWRFQYRYGGKQKLLAFGAHPEVSLAEARELRERARKELAAGRDPGEVRKVERETAVITATNTFRLVAEEWYKKNVPTWSPKHASTVIRRLEREVYPVMGDRVISEITPLELVSLLQGISSRGLMETAARIRGICGQIFRYASVTGRVMYDPSATLKPSEILGKRKVRHLSAVTDPQALGPLVHAIDGYQGTIVVKSALQLTPLLFVRPGELQKMEWAEVDLDAALWSIPAERMKMRVPHTVPLSRQSLEILQRLHPATKHERYVFPGRSRSRPISNNSVNAALRYLGFDKETVTGHGFRATARTILDEVLGFRVDLIEHQLAHAVKDPNGRAYNRTSFLQDRREMMQAWADYLDKLKTEMS